MKQRKNGSKTAAPASDVWRYGAVSTYLYIISALHTRVHRAAGLTVRLFFRTFFFPAIENRRDV